MACGCNSSPAKQARQAAKERRLSYAAAKKEEDLLKKSPPPISQTVKDTIFKHVAPKLSLINGSVKDAKLLQNKNKKSTKFKNFPVGDRHLKNIRPKLIVS